LTEWQVLDLAVCGQSRRVGREEGERRRLILAVLGKVEMHATDEIPRRTAALEEILNRVARCGQLGSQRRVDVCPESLEDSRRQVLRAGHRRRRRGYRLQLVFRRGWDMSVHAALHGSG